MSEENKEDIKGQKTVDANSEEVVDKKKREKEEKKGKRRK